MGYSLYPTHSLNYLSEIMYKLATLVFLVASATSLPRSFRRVPGGGKIVGGEEAMPSKLPHQLSLLWRNQHICGASIIGPNLAVTAAHCVKNEIPSDIKVVAGKDRRAVAGPNEQIKNVVRIQVHEEYDSITFLNDIALLHLEDPFVYDDFVKAIELPTSMEETTGDIIVSGWGTTSSGGSLADRLMWVQLPTIADGLCQTMYPFETIAPSMLCAGFPQGGKDSCQGDSGGPLITVGDNPKLVGLVSWGYGCGAAGYPGVNTQVSYFIDWIGI